MWSPERTCKAWDINKSTACQQCGLLPRHLVQVLDNALSMAINEGSTNVTTSHIRATIATLANADDGGGM